MMLSKVEAGKKVGGGSNNKKFLNEIDAISKAFYLENKTTGSSSTSNTRSRSKSTGKVPLPDAKAKFKSNTNEDLPHKDKKSIWKNWKPLKAFSSVKNRRFKCCFSLQAHSIEGLPSRFNDVSFVVHWKRRDGGLVTRPAKVCDGTVEFDEKLTHTCLVYGSRNGPHHSANYEAKHFLLYASVFEAPEFDLGKHRVDLTRLLPLTLEELEEEKSSGKWTTSFKLSGKARGATMNVSFGYTVIGDNCPSGNNLSVHPVLNMKQNNLTLLKPDTKFGPSDGKVTMQHVGSLPSKFNQRSHASSQSVENVKDLHEVLPILKSELASSVSMLYQKFDEEKLDASKLDVFIEHAEPIKPDSYLISNSGRVDVENEREGSVIEQGKGIELPSEEPEKPEEDAATAAADFSVERAEVDSSVSMLYQKFDEEKLDSSKLDVFMEQDENECEHHFQPDFNLISNSGRVDFENECEQNEFSVIEQGIELPVEEQENPEEDATRAAAEFSVESAEADASARVAFEEGNELPQDGDGGSEQMGLDCGSKVDDICSKDSLMEELQSALISVSNLETEALGSPNGQENYMGVKMDHTRNRLGRSQSLDDVTESVASEFLNMLGIEHSPFGLSSESDPESPRERLLRQFEKDTLTGGFSLFDFGLGDEDQAECGYNEPTAPEWGDLSKDFELSSTIQAAEEHRMETQNAKSKMRATMLEDLETEALMRELGLDEKAFQCSPHKSSTGFGSPIDVPLEEPLELPPLGEGLGPFLQTKNGGFLRSMNPSLFSKAKSTGNLIMQASSPVVVPAEMGSGIMEILQVLASDGIEKLSMQANKLMPLEDITGRTMQQVAWEAAPTLEGTESQYILQLESEVEQDLSSGKKRVKTSSGARSSEFNSLSVSNQVGSEYVSLEDLAPLAMDKIEALSMEGLRIQSGMSDEDAPSNISAQSIGEISAFQGKGANITGALGLEGTAGLQLLDIKDTGDEIDGLMGLSLTLDEWMRLDSGDIYDEDQISERTSKILAAHHATSLDLIRGGSKGERRRGKGAGRKCGLLGNNFTVALMVQLRDPLRNYEPVGAPMLSLIQVERVFVPPKPKIYRVVSEVRNNNEEDDESESVVKEVQEKVKEEKISEERGIPEYRVTEVHVAGLKTEPGKKKLWGTKTQQQSGSRWLLANGMGKSNKNIMKSNTVSKSAAAPVTTVQSDTLWSISSHINGTRAKRKELAALNPLKRNPNVILPNETIRLK